MDDPILLVEDDSLTRMVIAEMAQQLGSVVIDASHGQEAWDLLNERLAKGEPPPRLILLDLKMPVMDGLTFRKKQLEHKRFVKIPVVVITGNDDSLSDEAFRNIERLTKPITVEALRRVLR